MKHGTRNAYNYHRCRCVACVHANRIYARAYWHVMTQRKQQTKAVTK
jgi:hypothetical protein